MSKKRSKEDSDGRTAEETEREQEELMQQARVSHTGKKTRATREGEEGLRAGMTAGELLMKRDPATRNMHSLLHTMARDGVDLYQENGTIKLLPSSYELDKVLHQMNDELGSYSFSGLSPDDARIFDLKLVDWAERLAQTGVALKEVADCADALRGERPSSPYPELKDGDEVDFDPVKFETERLREIMDENPSEDGHSVASSAQKSMVMTEVGASVASTRKRPGSVSSSKIHEAAEIVQQLGDIREELQNMTSRHLEDSQHVAKRQCTQLNAESLIQNDIMEAISTTDRLTKEQEAFLKKQAENLPGADPKTTEAIKEQKLHSKKLDLQIKAAQKAAEEKRKEMEAATKQRELAELAAHVQEKAKAAEIKELTGKLAAAKQVVDRLKVIQGPSPAAQHVRDSMIVASKDFRVSENLAKHQSAIAVDRVDHQLSIVDEVTLSMEIPDLEVHLQNNKERYGAAIALRARENALYAQRIAAHHAEEQAMKRDYAHEQYLQIQKAALDAHFSLPRLRTIDKRRKDKSMNIIENVGVVMWALISDLKLNKLDHQGQTDMRNFLLDVAVNHKGENRQLALHDAATQQLAKIKDDLSSPPVPPTLQALASNIVNVLMTTQEISPLDRQGRDVLRALLMKEAEEQVGKGHDEHSMSTHLWGIARNELYTRWPETYVADSLPDAPSILSGSASNSTGFGGSQVTTRTIAYKSQTGFTRDKQKIVGGRSDSDSNSDVPEHETAKDTVAAKPASKPSGAQPKPSAKVAAGAGDDPPPGGPNAPPNVALPGHPVVPVSQQTGVAIARGEPDPDGGGGGENAQNPLVPVAPEDQDAADENDEMDDDAPPPMGPLAMILPWEVEHKKEGGYMPKWMPLGNLYQDIYKTMDPQKYCKDNSWLSYLGLQKPKNWQGH